MWKGEEWRAPGKSTCKGPEAREYWIGQKFVWVFCYIVWENPNNFIGQHNTLVTLSQ